MEVVGYLKNKWSEGCHIPAGSMHWEDRTFMSVTGVVGDAGDRLYEFMFLVERSEGFAEQVHCHRHKDYFFMVRVRCLDSSE